jgi:hypothetical protein
VLRESLSTTSEDRIRHSRGFYSRFHIMRSQNMHALENQGGVDGEISVQAIFDRCIFSISCEHPTEKRLARRPGQQGESQRLQLLEAAQQRIVLLKVFSKTEPRVQDDSFSSHTGQHRSFHPFPEFAFDQ